MNKKEEIKNFINSNFPSTSIKIDENTDLFESNVIDSLGVMEMVAFLEETFNINFNAKQMTADNFKNINSILRLISKDEN